MTLRLELRRSEQLLEAPLVNAGAAWDRRTLGSLTLYELDAGVTRVSGRGEASPLPGYSPDTDADVERALGGLDSGRLAALAAASSVHEVFDAVARLAGASPAARFGLETALLDRLARAAGRPLWQLLADVAGTGLASRDVALAGLVPSADPARAAGMAQEYLEAGVQVLKLKIGPECLRAEQLATLEALRRRFGRAITVRLDANGSLAPAALGSTLAQLARFEPELLEEPVRGMGAAELATSPCPLALDESLQELSDADRERLLERTGAVAVVLKPTTLGGLGACLRLAAIAGRLGRDAIVSHALEGPLGWSACAHLALALASPRAAGLWPLAHQRAARPALENGRLPTPGEPGLGGLP